MPVRPRPHVQRLAPYEWEASASEVARQASIPESAVVRFDTNTAPWPPVAWEQTVVDVPRLPANEYPHPSNEPLRSALAEKLGVAPDQVVVTSGADEALYLVAQVLLGPGLRAVLPVPSFAMFRVVTEAVGGDLLTVPLEQESWRVPPVPLLDALRQPDVAVAWLCSPNNPTGRLIEPETIEAALQAAPDVLVVVDEAYYEIAGQTVAPLLASGRYPNLLLVRTFSKGYGLAGARVGYAVGAREVIGLLDSVRLPQNLSIFGIQAAYRALRDQAGLEERVALLRGERERLGRALEARGWQVVPSCANFLLAKPPLDALALAQWLQGGGLIVRSYPGNPRLSNYLRLSVRAPEENERLLERVNQFSESISLLTPTLAP